MPRIRTIKPEFFTSLSINDLAPLTRLAFIGIWTHVDDEGRCIDDARLIKAAVSPLERTVAAIEADLVALAKQGRIIRYEADGKRLLQVANWHEHQYINRPRPSKFAGPDGVSDHGGLTEHSRTAHARKGKERNREGRGTLVAISSQSSSAPAELDDDGLTRIRQALNNCPKSHAAKTADFVLAKAPADVRNPVAYVLRAIETDPDLYRYRRGNPKRGEECPTHAGEWADACRACAADQKAGNA